MKKSRLTGTVCACVITILCICIAPANATIIRADFSGTVINPGVPFAGGVGSIFTGHYTYDDTATAIGPAPGVFLFGTAYPALSFVIDGASVGSSPIIAIHDDISGTGGFDLLWVLTGTTGYPAFQLAAPDTLWTGESLSVLDGLTFSDFSQTFLNGVSRAGPIDGNITAWNQASVPIPAAVWLFGSGLLSLIGLTRYKKA